MQGGVRTVLLTSGTLSPMPSFAQELGMYGLCSVRVSVLLFLSLCLCLLAAVLVDRRSMSISWVADVSAGILRFS